MTTLTISLSQTALADLHQLRRQAAEHPFDVRPLAQPVDLELHRRRYRDQVTKQSWMLSGPMSFVVDLMIETGHPNQTIFRHMSMRSQQANIVPQPPVVWLVAQTLGFTDGFKACRVWFQMLDDNGRMVHVMQPVTVSPMPAPGPATIN